MKGLAGCTGLGSRACAAAARTHLISRAQSHLHVQRGGLLNHGFDNTAFGGEAPVRTFVLGATGPKLGRHQGFAM